MVDVAAVYGHALKLGEQRAQPLVVVIGGGVELRVALNVGPVDAQLQRSDVAQAAAGGQVEKQLQDKEESGE